MLARYIRRLATGDGETGRASAVAGKIPRVQKRAEAAQARQRRQMLASDDWFERIARDLA
jgi:hypothetical protein